MTRDAMDRILTRLMPLSALLTGCAIFSLAFQSAASPAIVVRAESETMKAQLPSVIRPCHPADFDAMYAIINDAAQAYRGVIPTRKKNDATTQNPDQRGG